MRYHDCTLNQHTHNSFYYYKPIEDITNIQKSINVIHKKKKHIFFKKKEL